MWLVLFVDLKVAELARRLVGAWTRCLVPRLAVAFEEGWRSILVSAVAFEVADEVRSCEEIFLLVCTWAWDALLVSFVVHKPTSSNAES